SKYLAEASGLRRQNIETIVHRQDIRNALANSRINRPDKMTGIQSVYEVCHDCIERVPIGDLVKPAVANLMRSTTSTRKKANLFYVWLVFAIYKRKTSRTSQLQYPSIFHGMRGKGTDVVHDSRRLFQLLPARFYNLQAKVDAGVISGL